MLVGMTGGIGSGKSTLAGMLRYKGYTVFDCDEAAKQLYTEPSVILAVKKLFGENIYTDKVLDKKALADIVFNDKEALEKLNAIIHPRVKQHLFVQMRKSKDNLYFVENAILFESGMDKEMDIIICITAPKEVRIDRVMRRDRIVREKVEARMKMQISEEERISKSNYVIDTNQDIEQVKRQLFSLVERELKCGQI